MHVGEARESSKIEDIIRNYSTRGEHVMGIRVKTQRGGGGEIRFLPVISILMKRVPTARCARVVHVRHALAEENRLNVTT